MFAGDAADAHVVLAVHFVPGMHQAIGEFAVVGQQDQAF
jgi:hypothetical protein